MTRDVQAEKLLERYGVEFAYCAQLAVADINRDASLQNQARMTPLIPSVVEQYERAMRDGDDFPAVVLNKNGRGLVVISGNHRTEAARRAGKGIIDAYVAQIKDEMVLDILTRSFNAMQGQPESDDERLEHARHLCEKYGMTMHDAAKTMRISEYALYAATGAERAAQRLVAMGVDAVSLKRIQLYTLQQIKNDNVLKVAGQLAIDARLSREGIDTLRLSINAKRTEAQQIGAVMRARERLLSDVDVSARKLPIQFKRRAQFRGYLTGLANMMARHKDLNGLQLSDPKIAAEVLAEAKQILKRVTELLNHVNAPS